MRDGSEAKFGKEVFNKPVLPVMGDSGFANGGDVKAEATNGFAPTFDQVTGRATSPVRLEGGCPGDLAAFEGGVVADAGAGEDAGAVKVPTGKDVRSIPAPNQSRGASESKSEAAMVKQLNGRGGLESKSGPK